MERTRHILWNWFLIAIFILPLSGCSLSGRTSSYEEARAIAEEAYIFAYPMLENYRMMQVHAITSGSFNRFIHAENLLGPEDVDVLRPHNDTLSSTAWLDLRAEPVVLRVPPVSDRYYSFQFVDMYTSNFAYVGTRSVGSSGGVFLIAGPEWNGKKPRGVDSVFQSEGNFVFCIGRTALDGPEDLEKVRALQRRYTLQPLSEYLGTPAPETPPSEAFPLYMKIAADSVHFISYLNFLMGQTRAHPSEESMFDRFGLVGIGPSFHFNANDFNRRIRDAVDDGVVSALEQIGESLTLLHEERNGWTLFRRVFGNRERMQGLYLVRAGAAKEMLYGADPEEVSYLTANLDADGDPLDASKHSYVLVFGKDELPPVDAFWSITMYALPGQHLVPNPLNRYALGSKNSSLVFHADGALTIHIRRDSPGGGAEGNWLPAPDGLFSLTLRMYLPKEGAVPPHYVPPALRKVR